MIFDFFRGGWGVARKEWGGWVGGIWVWLGGDLGKAREGEAEWGGSFIWIFPLEVFTSLLLTLSLPCLPRRLSENDQ